jgi:transcriptional regulator with XRE-family HTH domain
MELHVKIVTARKKKGLTQEQLADLTGVTVRTIQRIESGQSTPRSYTLKTIATALDINFEELITTATNNNDSVSNFPQSSTLAKDENGKHFLELVCLSCFSYLCVPFVHFLIPSYLLKKSKEQNPEIIAFARKLIRVQLYWKFSLWLIMLFTLAYNLLMAVYFQRSLLLNYLWPFFIMYFLNAFIITYNLRHIKKARFSLQPST